MVSFSKLILSSNTRATLVSVVPEVQLDRCSINVVMIWRASAFL